MNEVGKAWTGMSRMFQCKSLRVNAKRRVYEGVIVPNTLFGNEI